MLLHDNNLLERCNELKYYLPRFQLENYATKNLFNFICVLIGLTFKLYLNYTTTLSLCFNSVIPKELRFILSLWLISQSANIVCYYSSLSAERIWLAYEDLLRWWIQKCFNKHIMQDIILCSSFRSSTLKSGHLVTECVYSKSFCWCPKKRRHTRGAKGCVFVLVKEQSHTVLQTEMLAKFPWPFKVLFLPQGIYNEIQQKLWGPMEKFWLTYPVASFQKLKN